LRRIVVVDKGKGVGRAAISAMEVYRRDRLRRRRIWLDVFESNLRGRQVYDRLGYRLIDNGELRGQKLLLLKKNIAEDPDPAE
jgi:RimJ/RimL family protein N-acetyltransferase